MKEIDFKIIKPLKRFSKYYNKDYYVLPCEIVEFSEKRLRHNANYVTLKIIDPFEEKLVLVTGIIYDKTTELFNEMGLLNFPIKTQCCLYKDCGIIPGSRLDFVVYGFFNNGLIENIFGINEDGFLSENEKNLVFKNNYSEVIDWLKK
jgi:hypothetical protein